VLSAGVSMRTIGLVSALIAIVGLILVEFLFRDQLQRSSEREKVEATHSALVLA
jgi:hypothetical protein